MRWAAIQMRSGIDVDENLESARGLIAEAVEQGAKLVSLPENFALMAANPESLIRCAHDRGTELGDYLAGEARRHGIVLIGGSIPIPSADGARVHASCRVHGEDGRLLADYEKIHLFDVTVTDTESYRESAYTAHGKRVVSVDTGCGNIGLSICYDIRFPELYRQLAAEGVQSFSIPSAFTVPTGKAHWEVLLRARAVENLSFVIAAAQSGSHGNGRTTYGYSMIVGPWGNILACLPEGEGACVAEVDLSILDELRARLPVLDHRRL